jgi:very-short-patch-repair endonuclease
MQGQSTLNASRNARALRIAMTEAERRLWSRLRLEQLGFKFRRQHPLGAYVLDFACLDPRLAIEVDGSQHFDQAEYDARRDRWLESHGFRVLRFAANEVLSNTDGVLRAIHRALLAPTPPLPQRGREEGDRA